MIDREAPELLQPGPGLEVTRSRCEYLIGRGPSLRMRRSPSLRGEEETQPGIRVSPPRPRGPSTLCSAEGNLYFLAPQIFSVLKEPNCDEIVLASEHLQKLLAEIIFLLRENDK